MKLIFSDMSFPTCVSKSIFLAGPSPRDANTPDCRHHALSMLKDMNFDGTVFIPIPKNKFYGGEDTNSWTYLGQIQWECQAREMSDLIVFWLARDILGKMPGFTTNIEFGEDLASAKIVYGRPDAAEKNRYLDKRYEEAYGKTPFNDLKDTLAYAVESLGSGALRTEGEVHVPLLVWKTPQFQSWYQHLKMAGNTLVSAQVKDIVVFKNNYVFSFRMKVNIWVASEQRHKANEFIISRRDTSAVLAYYDTALTTSIVLVKEFRSTVNNPLGYVYELPGGSSLNENINALVNAQHELQEETGLHIEDVSRFEAVAARQVSATNLTHQTHVYKVSLTEEEFLSLKSTAEKNQTFGVVEDTEQTMVEIVSLDALDTLPLDWSVIGMILSALKYKAF